ncbi:50S ribosomal protein L5 [Candidatus Woesearchaeota archaeon]|nr:50S ribosomal protein L5P [uncultured archaeon]MBS3157082.1 50S ribosomal protein L5 [Candidatus Woesearchaeota archaeon]
MNKMQEIRIEKISLSIGVGQGGDTLDKAVTLLESLSGRKAIQTVTQKRIPTWNVRPGLAVGCLVTLRKDKVSMLKDLLAAIKMRLKKSQFSGRTMTFGVPEYIEIPGARYNPEIGIIGLQVSVTLERPGYSITKRSVKKSKVGNKSKITTEETIKFMKEKYNVEVEE